MQEQIDKSDYQETTERAIRRLDHEADHDMFTLITANATVDGEGVEESILSSIETTVVENAGQLGLYRFTMLHNHFEMVVRMSDLSRQELAVLLAETDSDRTLLSANNESL